ncbi:MAG: putative zinc-binding peptidase [Acetobacteraceae bacterium]|nr:putative zinc-binding peptidase [Acetobacteraceae bacterium]
MKLYNCQSCGQLLFFENTTCERCGHKLGFLPETTTLSALEPADGPDTWYALAGTKGSRYKFCANAVHDVCNWVLPADSAEAFCVACRHNRTIPDLSNADNLAHWRQLEIAKHRLFYSLLRLNLPLTTRGEDPEHGLVFDFMADTPTGPKVMTGHDNGVIVVALKEADDAEREKLRTQMREPYRTLLGHFRHEIGHHYWDILVRDGAPGNLDDCRAIFGNDSEDYGEALQVHYNNGPPPDWAESFISAYATTHPWEDFAETWAHYLHMIDTLETASVYGLRVQPKVDSDGALYASIDFDPYAGCDIEQVLEAWVPLTFAMNSLNRSMGLQDPYPFVIAPPVFKKLGFIHGLMHQPPLAAAGEQASAGEAHGNAAAKDKLPQSPPARA